MRHFLCIPMLALAVPAMADDRWMTVPDAPAMPTAAASGMAAVNGISMYYATYGAGDPVLLIHGGLGHADIWANQVIDLMADHLVIVADSRGHGRSTRNADPYGYDLMAADYLALLDQLPQLCVLGGCCGTDHRHVAAAAHKCLPVMRERALP